jgi:hypothetical protein
MLLPWQLLLPMLLLFPVQPLLLLRPLPPLPPRLLPMLRLQFAASASAFVQPQPPLLQCVPISPQLLLPSLRLP